MTAVCGIEHPEGVWLGTDSFIGNESIRDVTDRPKWFYRGRYLLVAYAGALRGAQVASLAPPTRRQRLNEADQDYLVRAVVESIRQAHKSYEVQKPADDGTDYLIGYNGCLYMMQDDYSILRSKHGYAAIGVGQDMALGALAALQGEPLEPKVMIERALRAAARHCPQVGPPFHVVNVPRRSG